LKLTETELCCASRFPLIASCYKILESQTSFTLCLGNGNDLLFHMTQLMRRKHFICGNIWWWHKCARIR